MIFQDIFKHNKKPITFVSNLFANLNGISDLFRVFWPEIRFQLHVNGFAETYAVKLGSTLFVRKTHANLWIQLKQYHVTLLQNSFVDCLIKQVWGKNWQATYFLMMFHHESITPWKFQQAIQQCMQYFLWLASAPILSHDCGMVLVHQSTDGIKRSLNYGDLPGSNICL